MINIFVRSSFVQICDWGGVNSPILKFLKPSISGRVQINFVKGYGVLGVQMLESSG